MSLENQYIEETGEMYIKKVHLYNKRVEAYSDDYVNWLENKLTTGE